MQQMPSANVPGVIEEPDALAAALMEVAALVTREVRTVMRAHRDIALSVPQFRALGYVRRHPACSLTMVAEHLGLSVPAASRLVDALVANGLMLRQPSTRDRRFVTLQLSPPGERIQNDARSAALRSLAARLEPLGPQQRAAIARALDPLREAFPAATASAATGEEPRVHNKGDRHGSAARAGSAADPPVRRSTTGRA